MDRKTVQFEVSSPQELSKLLGLPDYGHSSFAQLRVFGSSVLTRQFNFPKTSMADLVSGLKLEASEVLFVSSESLEIAYQLINCSQDGMQGVYSAIARPLLLEYRDCFKKSHLIPLTITSSAIGAVLDFLKNHQSFADNFCLVNFLKEHAANIIIFTQAKPSFFRELYEMNDADFKDKITDTIRYSSSLSPSKSIDQIFFTGQLNGRDVLIRSLKELEQSASFEGPPSGGIIKLNEGRFNLLENYAYSQKERGRLIFFLSILAPLSVLGAVFLIWQLQHDNVKLQQAKFQLNALQVYENKGNVKNKAVGHEQ